MKPSKLYEALHALIGERVPLHIWARAVSENRKSPRRSRTISTLSSWMFAPYNSIRLTSGIDQDQSGPD